MNNVESPCTKDFFSMDYMQWSGLSGMWEEKKELILRKLVENKQLCPSWMINTKTVNDNLEGEDSGKIHKGYRLIWCLIYFELLLTGF